MERQTKKSTDKVFTVNVMIDYAKYMTGMKENTKQTFTLSYHLMFF